MRDREAQLNKELANYQEVLPDMSAQDIQDAALAMLRQLPELADDDHHLADIGRAFRILNLQMFVRFQPIQKGKRVENKVSGGVITLGEASQPTTKYTGPTATTAVKPQTPRKQQRSENRESSKHKPETNSDGKANSSRNDRLRER